MRSLMLGVLLSIVGTAVAAQPCPPLPGMERIVGPASTRFIIFGEVHGTAEAPELFGDAVCHAAAAEPVVVALEVDVDAQPVLDAFMEGDGAEASRLSLLQIDPWDRGWDGRGSQAMLTLMDRLRRLKAGRADLTVRAALGPSARDLPQAYHELNMAAAWGRAAADGGDARVFALVGSLHARKTQTASMTFRPAATLLPPGDVTSLYVGGGRGQAWNMQRGGCGANPYGRESTAPRSVVLRPEQDGAFDGVAEVRRGVTASPPANGRRDCSDLPTGR